MQFSKTLPRIDEGIGIAITATSRSIPVPRRGDENWWNPKVLAAFFVLFFFGIACGALITTSVMHSRFHNTGSGQIGLTQLKARLHLTPEQQQVVTQELDDYVKYYQNIEEERQDVAEHGKRRILSVLNPEQKKAFLEIFGGSSLPTKSVSEQ